MEFLFSVAIEVAIAAVLVVAKLSMRVALTIAALAILLTLSVSWYYASLKSSFWIGGVTQASAMFKAWDWTTVTQYDLISANIFISLWLVYRETNVVLLMALIVVYWQFGNLVLGLYILIALYRCKGDMVKFFLGDRASATSQTA